MNVTTVAKLQLVVTGIGFIATLPADRVGPSGILDLSCRQRETHVVDPWSCDFQNAVNDPKTSYAFRTWRDCLADVPLKVWTYQRGVDLLVPGLVIDSRKGQYWADDRPDFRYQAAISELWQRLGTDQFLWCYTVRNPTPRVVESRDQDMREYELAVADDDVLGLHDNRLWERFLREGKSEWNDLILDRKVAQPSTDISAWVRWPLDHSKISCLGLPPARHKH